MNEPTILNMPRPGSIVSHMHAKNAKTPRRQDVADHCLGRNRISASRRPVGAWLTPSNHQVIVMYIRIYGELHNLTTVVVPRLLP